MNLWEPGLRFGRYAQMPIDEVLTEGVTKACQKMIFPGVILLDFVFAFFAVAVGALQVVSVQ